MRGTIEERLQHLELMIQDVSISFADYSLYSSPASIEVGDNGERYIISVSEEIIRLLSTPIGSRVMRPEYGSELYKLRDREFNDVWRLLAARYTFVAINRYIDRVRCRKVTFDVQGDGKIKMKLELEKR